MTTFVAFVPSNQTPFQFQATLDGDQYTIIVKWNWYSQRFYIDCLDSSNNRIFTLPLIGSPNWNDINLANGYFLISTLVFRQATQTFEINP